MNKYRILIYILLGVRYGKNMIRRAEIRDVELLKPIMLEADRLHSQGRPDLFNPVIDRDSEEIISLIKGEEKEIYVYEENETVVGYVIFEIQIILKSQQLKGEERIYISNLCVDENCRHRGIATKLFNYVVDLAKNNGCYNVVLCCWDFNDGARKFYEKLGMKPQRTIMELIVE